MTRQLAPLPQGDCRPPRTIGPLTVTDIVRFAGASGDFNPLHHDAAAAAEAGFSQPIAHGQFTAGLLAGWVSDWVGVERIRGFEIRFVAPLLVGETVTISGELIVSDPPDEATRIITVQAAKENDIVIATGTAYVSIDPAIDSE